MRLEGADCRPRSWGTPIGRGPRRWSVRHLGHRWTILTARVTAVAAPRGPPPPPHRRHLARFGDF